MRISTPRWMGRGIGCGVACALAAAACRGDRTPPARPAAPPAAPGKVEVALRAPGEQPWNHEDSVVVTVTNGTAAPVAGASLELFVQAPLAVPRDTAAAALHPAADSTAAGTRLTFPLGTVGAGGTVELHQRVHTPPAPVVAAPPVPLPGAKPPAAPASGRAARAAAAAKPDTGTRFVIRATLRSKAGAPLAPPVIDTLRIVKGSEVTVGGCGNAGDVVVTRYGIGPVRVGMQVNALRASCPEARDTAWQQEGTKEAGVVVLPGGHRVVAVTTGGVVSRIVIDQPGLKTAAGDGVGTPVAELRAALGKMCAGTAEKQVAIWFPNAPGLSFALDTAATRGWPPARIDPDSISDTLTVAALWVRQGTDDCPARPGESGR